MNLVTAPGPPPGAAPPPLLAVAHGSRDARHGATVRALVARAAALRPGLRVETSFLDRPGGQATPWSGPPVAQMVERLAVRGHHTVVVVPLLLNRAFHASSDIPAVLAEATAHHPGLTIVQGPVLGPSPLLVAALERRLGQAGVDVGDPHTGVVLASVGSTDPEANAVTAKVAREWRRTGWCAVVTAFASAPGPTTAEAVRRLRADGVRRVAVAPYVLAPGLLPDRIRRGAREAGADAVADVLGDAPEVARLLLHRYDQAAGSPGTAHPPLTA
ncbi:cobalamin biosynthesis protein CbiX [Wenjunlia vitaminophila]|uniref:Cobalamin biosynthesis protein CbiX n=1 Tax=Wenjunlia vitaminophila TaxID=76728 RepID=A0A0T6LZ06_WENVI|nr:sirohydrochlorin chelatase [Wenjunlia vitaminophila]KRV51355.1 cobalamin biosynthesis protein CbiX [Wenjunlia vitaminophila]